MLPKNQNGTTGEVMAKNQTLIIVESPAKAKTISHILGKNYKVKSSKGHLRDLPKSKFGVDIENDFEPQYINIRGRGPLIRELKEESKNSKKVFLATDPDREGEAIAWHLKEILEIKDEECRIEFHEITKDAVRTALKKPKSINMNLVNAQQARRILDRVVGYNLSPLLWRKVKRGLSAGRVQSAALRMIWDREEEILHFQPEEYWDIMAILLSREGEKEFEAKLVKKKNKNIKISDRTAAENIKKELEKATFIVSKVTKKQRKRNPYPPFTTSTLQQEASKKLNFSANRTMRIAQQLYEGVNIGEKEGTVGLITYMRTDSVRVAEEASLKARKYIEDNLGKNFLPSKPPIYKGNKSAQDAHEAIRPTSVELSPEKIKPYLTGEQFKLYKLIWERFLASQMKEAIFDVTTIEIEAGLFLFRANGAVISFPGFLKVYQDATNNEDKKMVLLPEVGEGEILIKKKLEASQHFTQPPSRYTEASLVKAMEENGIGRPSTYAPTLETLLERNYVVKEKKQLYPTELGKTVILLLKEYFAPIVDIEFTARMEEKLDKVEEGKIFWKDVLREFYPSFAALLEEAENKIEKIDLEEEELTDEVCEKCGKKMKIKVGRYGKFLACSGFPECKNTKPILEEIGVNCPECGSPLVKRRSKKGKIFYGCSRYPDCLFVSWDKPINKKCPLCQSLLVEKGKRDGEKKIACSNKNCDYSQNLEEKEEKTLTSEIDSKRKD